MCRRQIPSVLLAGLVLVCLALPAVAADKGVPPGFKPLFNGKDLTGWKLYCGTSDVWTTEDGSIVTSGESKGWLFTDKEYGDFELRLEFKVSPNGDSGVAIRAPRAGHVPTFNDPSIEGLEIQLLDDGGTALQNPGEFPTGSIWGLVRPTEKASRPAGQWNTLRIVARDRQLTVFLNDKKVVDAGLDDFQAKATKFPGLTREKGFLGLQSAAGQAEFRNLYIKE